MKCVVKIGVSLPVTAPEGARRLSFSSFVVAWVARFLNGTVELAQALQDKKARDGLGERSIAILPHDKPTTPCSEPAINIVGLKSYTKPSLFATPHYSD